MKKLLTVCLALCLIISAAAAETTVTAKDISAASLELNEGANTLLLRDEKTRAYRVTDADLNPLSDDYEYITIKGAYYEAENEELHFALLDGQGKQLLPPEYGDIEVISDRWAAGIRLAPATSDNYDYKSLFSSENAFYLIDSVDIYYMGEKKGTLSRAEWNSANGYGDYLSVRDRDGNYTCYNRDFVKSEAAEAGSREYEDDYKNKKVIHLGSGQEAFCAGCTLTADEVKQSVWVNNAGQLVDLQGNVIADLSGYSSANVDSDSCMIKLRNGEGKHGLADSTGKVLIPCAYDSLDYNLAGALKSGYLYAVKDGKGGFINLATGAETGFTFTEDAGKQRANFIIAEDPREGKILISAAAGELPGRYKEVQAVFSGDASACRYAVVQENDDTCRIIGQAGEDILPAGTEFKNVYDPAISWDGTMILLRKDRGEYTLYNVSYDPDLSQAAAPAPEADGTWTCENGHTGLTGNFCPECGAKKPE